MDKLQKYAKLVVKEGINIRPGEKLLIWCSVDAAYFARMVMKEAYTSGAIDVVIRWFDEASERISYLLAPDSKFIALPEWEANQAQHWASENYRMLWVCAPDPEVFKGVNAERIQKGQPILPDIQWTLVFVPTPAWASLVFSHIADKNEALSLLWDRIFTACRVDDNSADTHWSRHIEMLRSKAALLSELNFKYLHFTNSLGTDLKVQLPLGHIWITCTDENEAGDKFITNIPTEEIFTSPLRTGVNGIVYATRPIIYMGEIIEDFWFRFENGKVIDYAAKKNHHLLDELFTAHENADFLGEVALVPQSSPIAQLGMLWYESSFDENASCHLALGSSYPQTIKDSRSKSSKELMDIGLNACVIHEDFMIGTADMKVVGITTTGNEILILNKGEWAV